MLLPTISLLGEWRLGRAAGTQATGVTVPSQAHNPRVMVRDGG